MLSGGPTLWRHERLLELLPIYTAAGQRLARSIPTPPAHRLAWTLADRACRGWVRGARTRRSTVLSPRESSGAPRTRGSPTHRRHAARARLGRRQAACAPAAVRTRRLRRAASRDPRARPRPARGRCCRSGSSRVRPRAGRQRQLRRPSWRPSRRTAGTETRRVSSTWLAALRSRDAGSARSARAAHRSLQLLDVLSDRRARLGHLVQGALHARLGRLGLLARSDLATHPVDVVRLRRAVRERRGRPLLVMQRRRFPSLRWGAA